MVGLWVGLWVEGGLVGDRLVGLWVGLWIDDYDVDDDDDENVLMAMKRVTYW